jgi:hypothetical protein
MVNDRARIELLAKRPTFMKHILANVVVFGMLFAYSARPCLAEPSAADKSLATALFKEGRALVDQGHFAEGCRKLEESQRLDPGGGTLLNLALCHEKEGRTATAWAEFTEALGIAKRDDRTQRVEFARTHIAQLEPTLSRLVIQVPHGADIAELEIKRDGGVIGRAAWGLAMPVDPGDHLIEAAAPGKSPWKQSVNIGPKGDSKTLVVPPLENGPSTVATSPPGNGGTPAATSNAPSGPSTDSNPPVPDTAAPAHGGGIAAGWVAVGTGVLATGIGSYFALRAISKKSDADRDCPNDLCVGAGSKENSDAIKFANVATAGFAVGAVGLGVGAYLLLTSSGPRPAAAQTASRGDSGLRLTGAHVALAPGGGGLVLGGQFR